MSLNRSYFYQSLPRSPGRLVAAGDGLAHCYTALKRALGQGGSPFNECEAGPSVAGRAKQRGVYSDSRRCRLVHGRARGALHHYIINRKPLSCPLPPRPRPPSIALIYDGPVLTTQYFLHYITRSYELTEHPQPPRIGQLIVAHGPTGPGTVFQASSYDSC